MRNRRLSKKNKVKVEKEVKLSTESRPKEGASSLCSELNRSLGKFFWFVGKI